MQQLAEGDILGTHDGGARERVHYRRGPHQESRGPAGTYQRLDFSVDATSILGNFERNKY